MKKRTDAQLFRELRINTTIIALAIIIIFIAGFFMKDIGEIWYRFILFISGMLLLSYTSQKYLQEHPKVRIIIMWILFALMLIGIIIFFMINK